LEILTYLGAVRKFRRFFIVCAKGLAILAALLLLLILAAACFVGWLKWSADRDWKRVQVELKAKGEKLSFAEFIPLAPPDKENFFADPIWRELSDLVPTTHKENGCEYQTWAPRLPSEKQQINEWMTPLSASEKEQVEKLLPKASFQEMDKKTRLAAINQLRSVLQKTTDPERRKQIAALQLTLLQPAEPLLAKITELSLRPQAFFPTRWQDGVTTPLPHLTSLLMLSQLFWARGLTEMESDNSLAAFSDALTILRLSTFGKNEPILISYLVRCSILQQGLSVINSGIEQHKWNDVELTEFQKKLEGMNCVKDFCFSLRGERAFVNSVVYPNYLSQMPHEEGWMGFYDRSMVMFMLEYTRPLNSVLIQRIIETLEQNTDKGINASTPLFDQELKHLKADPIKSRLDAIEMVALPVFDMSVQKAIEVQTVLNQTLIACVLERYHLAHGSYPASLDALVPEYLSVIPKKPTTGGAMHYRLLDGERGERFLLWAPGWKLQTLGGKSGEFSGEGDIVWNLRLPSERRKTTP